MADKVTFHIAKSEDKKSDDLFVGHATVAQKAAALTGDIVVKEYLRNRSFSSQAEWMEKQKSAKKITDEIRAKNNPAYFVPRTFIAHGKVREEFASGVRWGDAMVKLSPEDKKWVYKALAEFINDMSELRPIKYSDKVSGVPGMGRINNAADLAQMLDGWDEAHVSAEDKKLIQDIYDYLNQIPENKLMVFGHNDLHGGNVFIDVDKKRIAIIDFELAGYKSAFNIMYNCGLIHSDDFWKDVNMLPRSKNPELFWPAVSEHRALYKFLSWGYYELFIRGKTVEKLSFDIKKQCQRIRPIFATAKLKLKKILETQKMPLVPMSHYERD